MNAYGVANQNRIMLGQANLQLCGSAPRVRTLIWADEVFVPDIPDPLRWLRKRSAWRVFDRSRERKQIWSLATRPSAGFALAVSVAAKGTTQGWRLG